jgi:hypothetical protein
VRFPQALLLVACACGRTSPYEWASPEPVVTAATECPFGALHGQVCATDGKTLLNGATVTVDAVDCHGAPVHVETETDAAGAFTLEGLPQGLVTVKASLGDFKRVANVIVVAGETSEVPGPDLCLEQQNIKIAVITGNGDKIERLLTDLHLTYTIFDGTPGLWPNGAAVFLSDLKQLKTYDLVFIDCAAATSLYHVDLGDEAALIESNLRDYVQSGGSLYASDWAGLIASFGAPGALMFAADTPVQLPFDAHNLKGFAPQTLTATISDEGLKTFLGKPSIAIVFPKASSAVSLHWGLLESTPGATVLATADHVGVCTDAACATQGLARDHVPLAVRVKVTPAGTHGGQVLYTSFHNIAQGGDDVARLLKYLVLNL